MAEIKFIAIHSCTLAMDRIIARSKRAIRQCQDVNVCWTRLKTMTARDYVAEVCTRRGLSKCTNSVDVSLYTAVRLSATLARRLRKYWSAPELRRANIAIMVIISSFNFLVFTDFRNVIKDFAQKACE